MIRKSLRNGLEIFRQSVPFFIFLVICSTIFSIITQPFMENIIESQLVMALVCLPALILYPFLRAGTLGYVYNKIKHENSSLSTFFSLGCKYFSSQMFFCIAIVFMLLTIVVTAEIASFAIKFFVPVAIASKFPKIMAIILVLGPFCLAAILWVYLTLRLFFASTIIVADNLKALPAMKKSWEITRKFFSKTFVFAAIYMGTLIGTRLLDRFFAQFNGGETIEILLIIGSSLLIMFAEIYFTAACMSIYLEFAKESR